MKEKLIYILIQIERSTQITLVFYDNYEYENDYTTLSFPDDYNGINEYYFFVKLDYGKNLLLILIFYVE